MTNENRIKTALLNEVIEMIKGNIKSGRLGEYEYRNNAYTRGLIKQVQSLLPKEEAIDGQIKEPVKSEPTQEIKVGQDVWLSKQGGFTHTVLSIDGDEAWIKRNHDGYSMVVKVYQIYNYIESEPLQKTQEEMDREKATQLLIDLGVNGGITHEVKMNFVLNLINESRNTKQG